jgi:hypothetical protein
MKRTVTITCGLLIFFAGIAGAWASCKQVLSVFEYHHGPQVTAHNHEHHSHSNHSHSHDSLIHCPNLDEFVPTANFSASKDNSAARVPSALMPEMYLRFTSNGIRSIHGPPGFSRSSNLPAYLLLSVLRI